jgi:2-(1,2-epoxy-1,2-dihydrophenyl)acetyl-CoA isomerase
MPDELLRYEVHDGIATVTLNRPEKLNPISLPLQKHLRERLAQVREDRQVRVLVITGAGKAFSVGAELGGMDAQSTSASPSKGEWVGRAMNEVTNPLVTELRELPVPTIAAINGAVAGGSVGLALACDIVIAARSAYFYLPFVPRLGLVPDVGSTWFLPRLVGPARAMGLTLLGDRLSAEQAAQWGLVWACVDDTELQATVRQTSQRLAALPAHGALEARRAFDAAEGNDLASQLRYEASRQSELFDQEAFAEGVSAFLDKRVPLFKGR